MFLSYRSVPRPPPFLLSGSPGVDSPPFNRYYEEAKTACALLVAFGFPRLPIPLRCNLFFALIRLVAVTRIAWMCSRSIRKNVCSRGGGRLSQVPVETLWTLTLFSDPGRNGLVSPLTTRRCCSRYRDYESSSVNGFFEAQSHGLCPPCLRFMPASQQTMQDSVPVGG